MWFVYQWFMILALLGYPGLIFSENIEQIIEQETKLDKHNQQKPEDEHEDVDAKSSDDKKEDAKDSQDEAKKDEAKPVQDVAKTAPKVIIPKAIVPKTQVSPVDDKHESKEDDNAKIVTTSAPVISTSDSSAPIQIEDVSVQDTSAGLDTLNINSGGNWLEKRIWYQKSEQLFEVIRKAVQKVTDLRMEFVRNVNHVGHEIDEFYETINFERGQIDELLINVDQAIQNEIQVRGGDLSSSERSLKAKVHQQKAEFEAVSKHLQMITDLDEQIDKTMMKAFKEIEACRSLETHAWNNFKEIGLELDDKRARTLYYEMENFHKNIEQKLSYLQSNLLSYLQNQLISKVSQTINQIKTKVSSLDSAGLTIKNLLQKDEQGDFVILKEREKLQEERAEQEQKAKQKKEMEQAGWYVKIKSAFMMILNKIYEWICVVSCCLQCVFCKIKSFICGLFGY